MLPLVALLLSSGAPGDAGSVDDVLARVDQCLPITYEGSVLAPLQDADLSEPRGFTLAVAAGVLATCSTVR